MQIRVQVITREHRTWPARDGQPAGESYDLICQDMSQPGDCRMTENLRIRLADDKVKTFWDNSIDKTFDVVVRRIKTDKSGKASIIGDILGEAKSK